ncbi:leucine-rich repeat extensin-like protein 3 [Schistocerca americana]|uniref:leucine-rich repeat extensin-like protein 3 n=1 Tax=Schistocerca americana TaxID=7009 RepID=UPI001F4FBD28|nr:leucine-rich repeat extensin-like protein 3 [Schistocerca americana]
MGLGEDGETKLKDTHKEWTKNYLTKSSGRKKYLKDLARELCDLNMKRRTQNAVGLHSKYVTALSTFGYECNQNLGAVSRGNNVTEPRRKVTRAAVHNCQRNDTVAYAPEAKTPTTPAVPHPLLAPPPRARLPSSSPQPVRSPAPDGRLSPPPWPHLRPPLPPPCSSTVPEPMDAEAAITPPPPPPCSSVVPELMDAEAAAIPLPPMEVVAPPHPSIPSGGAQSGQVFHGAFSSPPRKQLRVADG